MQGLGTYLEIKYQPLNLDPSLPTRQSDRAAGILFLRFPFRDYFLPKVTSIGLS